MRALGLAAVTAALLLAAPAHAFTPDEPWPPKAGPGGLFVHFGEEHWNDDDGLTLLPKVVEDSARYSPNMVTMSGDKADDGPREQLEMWHEIMGAYDRAGIPYFAAVGNHDRDSAPGTVNGAPPPGTLDAYVDVFKDRPYPFGDGPAPADPAISPRERPAGDPAGAASHYFVDYGDVRWVFIDNSCWVIDECDVFQKPSAQTQSGEGQFDFLRRVAREASQAGKVVFVVMHMATEDPGDQSYRDPIALNHVMGKGATDDNAEFEQVAEEVGIDAVLVAHIKGQFLYRGRSGIPYYIDGGAGGELYTTGPVGVDHGYWHGYRLLRVDGSTVTTDTVPIFVPDGIRIEGPSQVARGETVKLEAFGKQPVFKDPAKVEALELRDPDPRPSGGSTAGLASAGRWLLLPLALLLLLGLAARADLLARGGLAPLAVTGALVLLSGVGAVSLAQQSEPTSTKKENLPTPARIWTTSNPEVLAPVPSEDDDRRRDARTQTDSGIFAAPCPGRATIEVTSGWEAQRKEIASTSAPGPIARRVQAGRRAALRRGRRGRVASVLLAQPGEVEVRVRRGRRILATISESCFAGGARPLSVSWDGRVERRGKRRRVRAGIYTVEVRVRSDRKTVVRRARVRLR
jgi:hypothetical protein